MQVATGSLIKKMQVNFSKSSFFLSSVAFCNTFQFEDARDAEDAIEGRDGYKFDGQRLRVSDGMLDLIAPCL